MYQYESIISTVKENFPEIEIYKMQLLEPELVDWIINDDSPYIFFPVFWRLLEYALMGKVKNDGLANRIFCFMENMAYSDSMVRNLMKIEMLEPLFALDYDTYEKVITQHLQPKTRDIFNELLPLFDVPRKN